MIEPQEISEIIATYKKHGWALRRVLLSAGARNTLADRLEVLFPEVDVVDSDLDAAWFSRQSRPGFVAWELRRFAALPFALVTNVPAEATADELETALAATENSLRQSRRDFGHAG